MSRENLISDFGIMNNKFRQLQKARMKNEENDKIVNSKQEIISNK